MEADAPLVADREPPVLSEPRQRPLHHPPVPAQPLRALYPLPRYPALDAALPECGSAPGDVVPLIGVELVGTLPRPASRAFDRLDAIYQSFHHRRVVPVSGCQYHRERNTLPADRNVALRAGHPPGLAFVRRLGTGTSAPFLAGILALSRLALDQSSLSASPSRSSGALRNRPRTPASCQSRGLLQQVMPLPPPTSRDSVSRGTPDLSTKMMSPSTAPSATLGPHLRVWATPRVTAAR